MITGLYVITDEDRDGILPVRVEAALRGGARVVQYREKRLPREERVRIARELLSLCRRHEALFIINDDPSLVRDLGADGVHLGQGDMSVAEARAMVGGKALIGVSTRTVEQACTAEAQGADYLGVGSMYPTTTKGDAQLVGIDALRKIRRAVRLPLVAIGGIDARRAAEAIDAGADSVAVVSAVMGDTDPAVAAREIALQFNRRLPLPRGRVLTVAGSDSGGGAGIQADLKTVTLLGGYGASAVTALTAQNTLGVRGIHPAPPDFVEEQVEAVLSDIGADTLKTGMLFSAEIVAVVSRALQTHGVIAVVDPVMIAKGGAPLLKHEAVETLMSHLIPRTYLLTPNIPEAEALTGIALRGEEEMEEAARRLQQMGARNVLLKGGHLAGEATDLLLAGREIHRFTSPRVLTRNTHGTGCSYSAAIATFLAQGEPLVAAVGRAKAFINEAIRTALPCGGGHGPVNHWQGAKAVVSDER